MRIDLNNSIARQVAAERTAKNNGKQEATVSAAEDKTSFSHRIPMLSVLMDGAMAPSKARQERVFALRDAVSSGTYSVDADAVADAMLQESGK